MKAFRRVEVTCDGCGYEISFLTRAETMEKLNEDLHVCGWAVRKGKDLCPKCVKWHDENPGMVCVPLFGKTGIIRNVPEEEPASYDVADYLEDWDVLIRQIWDVMHAEQESPLITEVRMNDPRFDAALAGMETLLAVNFKAAFERQRKAAGATDGS